jgi:DNA-binding transcriptional LysR family regulator
MLSTTFRYFHEVARTGSIRKAAQNLNISASAISRQIAQLEHELDQPLIERLARGIRLTEAGRITARHLHQTLMSENVMRAKLAELSGNEIGRVQIAAIEGALSHVLPRAIRDYASLYSEIDVEIRIAGADTVAQTVRDDDTEVGVVFQPSELTRLVVHAEMRSPFCAILPVAHPMAGKRHLEFRDVAGMPLILNDHTFSARTHVERAARDIGVEIRSSVLISSIEGAKAMVAAGLGIAFMPRFGAATEIDAGLLAAVPLVDEALYDASLMVVAREGRSLSRPASAMLATLSATVKSLNIK